MTQSSKPKIYAALKSRIYDGTLELACFPTDTRSQDSRRERRACEVTAGEIVAQHTGIATH